MNNIERLTATLQGRETDRIMTYDLVDNTEVLKAYGGYNDEKKYSPEELMEINVKAFKGIGLDITRGTHDPVDHWMRHKVDNWIRFMGVDPANWLVEQGGDTAWISKRPFDDLTGLEKNLPSLPREDEIREWYSPFIRETTALFNSYDRVIIGGVEGPLCDAYTYVDLELFSLVLFDAPELIEHIMDCTCAYSEAIARIYSENETAPVQFMGEDIAGSTGPIFSPSMIEELCLERWQRIAAPIREKGGTFIFHTDGRYGPLLDLILGKDKFNAQALNPIERCGCNDIFEIHQAWPETYLFGNVCCEETLPYGNRADVEDETLELIEKAGADRKIFIGSSSEVHELIPLINIETMYNTVHEYGSYPLDLDRIRGRRREIASKRKVRKDLPL
ncbi:MAG: uroporphyrinogen decarboxylase family protein [Spirochaetales bacterium]|nr:uroporphyrinogen decarboxylase family protein [Spirochaetales bacterium]